MGRRGEYSSAVARKRFFNRYFDLNRWCGSQRLADLQRFVRACVQSYLEHPDFADIFAGIEWWSAGPDLRTCKRALRAVLQRKSEYALRNMLLLPSHTLADLVRMLRHRCVSDCVMESACAAAEREARPRKRERRAPGADRSSKKKRTATPEQEQALDQQCLQDELGDDPKFRRCSRHPRCVLQPHRDGSACKLLEVGDRFHMVFFGPPGTDAYDIYQGTVLEFLYYGKRVKARFEDGETCTVSLNSYWYSCR